MDSDGADPDDKAQADASSNSRCAHAHLAHLKPRFADPHCDHPQSCRVTRANGAGHWSVGGLPAGHYTARVMPPNTTLVAAILSGDLAENATRPLDAAHRSLPRAGHAIVTQRPPGLSHRRTESGMPEVVTSSSRLPIDGLRESCDAHRPRPGL